MKYLLLLSFVLSCKNNFIPDIEENHCSEACKNLKRLDCPESKSIQLKDGGIIDCIVFCNETINNGIKLKTSCVATIENCEDIVKCQ